MKISIKKYIPLLIILLLFIVAKCQHLALPHYWDEAWSYSTAVHKMYENGVTLLPGIVDVDATRGHPLFFYASASFWMKMFGTSLISKHSFALFISILLLMAVYVMCNKLYNVRVACVATILFASQIFFFVQSTMLLPEVMVALFSILSIYFFISERYMPLAISLSLLLLTKESGLVLGVVFAIVFAVLIFNKNCVRQQKIKMFTALLVPALVIASFFIVQKITYGWFFFPDHIGMIEVNLDYFSSKFQASLFVIFIEEKRKWLWLAICALTTFYAVKKKDYQWFWFVSVIAIVFLIRYLPFGFLGSPLVSILYCLYLLFICVYYWAVKTYRTLQNRFFVVAILFSIAYLIFCSVNFYTVRYLMPVLLLSFVAFAFWLEMLVQDLGYKLYLPVSVIIVLLSVQSYSKNNNIGDIGLGSYKALKVQQEVINYLVNQNAQNKQIGLESFQQRINLQNPACGFVKDTNTAFQNVRWDIDTLTDYAVFDNIEPDRRYDIIKNDSTFRLVFQVNKDNVWGAVFKRVQAE